MTSLRLLTALLLAAVVTGCNTQSPTAPTLPSAPFSSTDLRLGTGAEAQAGRRLTVEYSGWMYAPGAVDSKGSLFDTSAGRGPFSFVLGAGQVIRGWDQGVAGMRVGGIRRLVLPPELAYGASGNGPIPPNATLVFEVELLEVSQ